MAVPAQSRRGSLSPQIRKVKKPNLFSSWISSSIYFMAHVQSSWCPHLSCEKKKKQTKNYIFLKCILCILKSVELHLHLFLLLEAKAG